ncbi:unnamed protein product [Musa acuminata subsp. burmannicoides]
MAASNIHRVVVFVPPSQLHGESPPRSLFHWPPAGMNGRRSNCEDAARIPFFIATSKGV